MQKPLFRKIRKWFVIVAMIYILVGVALYLLQEKFIFHPKRLPADYMYNFQQPHVEVNLPVNEERSISMVQFIVPDSLRRGVVLYFHGNMENIGRYASFASHFTRNNWEVWMIDYPGFGKTTGKRSEQTMYADAMEMYKMARARFGADSIILYGRSIGTGVASQLASLRSSKRLILETPYYSMEAVMRQVAFIYPVSWMSRYHFPNYEYLEKVIAPVTLIHGTRDEVIRYSHSRRLLRNRKPPQVTELITVENGKHNNLHEFTVFQHKLDSLLSLP